MKILILLMIVVVALTAGAANVSAQKAAGIDETNFLGRVENGVYKNGYFGFEMNLPKDWNVVDGETTDAMKRIGADLVKGKNERNNKALEDSLTKEVVLLTASKKPIGAVGNSILMIGTLKQPSVHITPVMIAEATKSILVGSPTLKLTKDVEARTIAGRKFAVMEYEVTAHGQTVRIKYYVTAIRSYAISFGLTSGSDEHVPELTAAFDTLRFIAK